MKQCKKCGLLYPAEPHEDISTAIPNFTCDNCKKKIIVDFQNKISDGCDRHDKMVADCNAKKERE